MLDCQDDVQLLDLVARGDHAAFAVLYDRHARTVARYALLWSAEAADMQDTLQETFVTAWKKADSIRIVGSSLLPWLLVTCRNHANNQRRKVGRRREQPWDPLLENFEAPDAGLSDERSDAVMTAIANLDPRDQAVCRLCLIEGLSYKEAAHELGQSVAWVGKRLQRTRAHLRRTVMNDD